MGSSNEMFERGVQDAEHDDLNSFYYQHYYYYRKGYDKARRRLRRAPVNTEPSARGSSGRLLGVVAVFIVLFVGISFFWNRRGGELLNATGVQPVASSAFPTMLASPTRALRTPTPIPATPTPLPPVLQVQGAAVIVNLNGNPLRVRAGAGTKQRLVGRLPEGTEVKIIEGPTEADGYIWWHVEAGKVSGWVAERDPQGAVWLQAK